MSCDVGTLRAALFSPTEYLIFNEFVIQSEAKNLGCIAQQKVYAPEILRFTTFRSG